MDTIGKYEEHLLHIKKYSGATVKAYLTDIAQYGHYILLEYECADIAVSSHLMIRSWVVALTKEGTSNRSIRRKLSSLTGFFKYLLKLRVVSINPMAKVVAPKVSKKLPSFATKKEMSDHQAKAIINPDGFKHQRNTLIIELLYHTGMRRSELLNLTYTDINTHRKEIRVIGKGNKERVIPMQDKLLRSIERYTAIRNDQWPETSSKEIILSDSGRKMNPKSLYNIVKAYLSCITNAEKRSPHTLRHSFATHLLDAGADINAIKEILGHANLSATEVYTHVSVDRLKAVYKNAHPKA